MSNSNKIEILVKWRREDSKTPVTIKLDENRVMNNLCLLFTHLRRHHLLNKEQSYKLLQWLTREKIVSPGQLIFYGLFLNPTLLEKIPEMIKNADSKVSCKT